MKSLSQQRFDNSTQALPLTVYFDGACPLCSREIAHYRKLSFAGRLVFVDISATDFVAEEHGPTMAEFMARMHVRDARGEWFKGVDCFPQIWATLPGRKYRLLGRALKAPGLYPLAKFGYRIFAANRHRLPGRRECEAERCRLS